MLVFAEGGKPENPEKNPRSREENQHKLNPLMASGPGIKSGPNWWEASVLTTAPSLLPKFSYLTMTDVTSQPKKLVKLTKSLRYHECSNLRNFTQKK